MEAIESFSEYSRGFRRGDAGPSFYAMFTTLEAYFDDSADAQGERFCASGGFFGVPEQWDDFVIAWSQETHELKEPFHATDCEGGSDGPREFGYGQFADWPKDERVRLFTRLVDIVKHTGFAGFASIVPIQAYKKFFPNSSDGDAYLLTIPHTIINMAVMSDRSNVEVKIWFEGGGPVGFISETFKRIQKMNWTPAKRLTSLAFDSKRRYELQAADLIAREAFKRFDNMGVRPMRIPLLRIGERVFFIKWTEHTLEYLAAHGGLDNLELLAHWDEYPDAPKLEWDSLWLIKRGMNEQTKRI